MASLEAGPLVDCKDEYGAVADVSEVISVPSKYLIIDSQLSPDCELTDRNWLDCVLTVTISKNPKLRSIPSKRFDDYCCDSQILVDVCLQMCLCCLYFQVLDRFERNACDTNKCMACTRVFANDGERQASLTALTTLRSKLSRPAMEEKATKLTELKAEIQSAEVTMEDYRTWTTKVREKGSSCRGNFIEICVGWLCPESCTGRSDFSTGRGPAFHSHVTD